MNDKGEYHATRPTRLGNLISAYEDYPLRVYGMDSYFYWYRIWVTLNTLNNEMQEQIDSQQAIADSTIYSSFALFCVGLLYAIYAYIKFLDICWIKYLPDTSILVGFAFLAFAGGYCLYRASLHFHAHFGEIFKSLFDVYGDNVSVDKIIKDLADIIDDPELLKLPHRERFKVAWRYLHNYRIKTKEGKIVSPDFFSKQSK